jgi:hypothetical protein
MVTGPSECVTVKALAKGINDDAAVMKASIIITNTLEGLKLNIMG